MADNELFSANINHSSFDLEQDMLPLLTKERTQRFDLLLHLIPNLKQHIILLGQSGIGKTLLLDMLYDIESEIWQCCFVQGSDELSFEMVEAQLTKTMLRNNHVSLDSALNDFKEQHKKIVLIIDDAGLLVSGLMTTLIEYAASQSAIKLIFSLTPDARNNHRATDKALDDCYLLELPALNKQQTAFFLRHLATKPRTYSAVPFDEKLLDKIYFATNGIPAKIMAEFTKLSRKNENDTTKWIVAFAGIMILAIAINQSVHYFKDEPVEEMALPVQTPVTAVKVEEKSAPSTTESQIKNDADIVPEFQLDIEKTLANPQKNTQTETTETAEKPTAETTIESPVENIALETPVQKTDVEAEPEKVEIQKTSEPEPESKPVAQPVIEPEKVASPVTEKIPDPVTATPVEKIESVAPEITLPVKPAEPVIAFPKIEPAKGVKIQPLAEKSTIQATPLVEPETKEIKKKVTKTVIEPVKKIEIKPVEKPVEVKKPSPPKVEPVKKIEPQSTTEKKEKLPEKPKESEPQKETISRKIESTPLPQTKRYTLQLITLSSEQAIENFKKTHGSLANNFRIVKSGTEDKPRFGVMFGGFENVEDATKARETLPAEFVNALPRKN